jgi:hypothetical protein
MRHDDRVHLGQTSVEVTHGSGLSERRAGHVLVKADLLPEGVPTP